MKDKTNATLCSKCLFSDKKTECIFKIPELIKKDKIINKDTDGYNTIEDYRCSYAFHKKIYEDNKDELGSIQDVANQVRRNNTIRYSLCLLAEGDADRTLAALRKIKKLSIYPSHIQIIGLDINIEKIYKKLEKKDILPKGTTWKCNGFYVYTDYYDMIRAGTSTNNQLKTIPFMMFANENTIEKMEKNDIVGLINYLIYVIRDEASILISNTQSDEDSKKSHGLYGSFMTKGAWAYVRSYMEMDNFTEILELIKKEFPHVEVSEYAY
jgi:hypothetical protein